MVKSVDFDKMANKQHGQYGRQGQHDFHTQHGQTVQDDGHNCHNPNSTSRIFLIIGDLDTVPLIRR